MSLPTTAYPAPINITRTSHLVLTVRDLDASETFYTEVIGLVVSQRTTDTLYLRGVEEACHHSLVLRQSPDPVCQRIGMRVFTDDDLKIAHDWFAAAGCAVAWVAADHQGSTLHVTDPAGIKLELCATMPVMPRMITRFSHHRGGVAQRLDHYQLLVPEVEPAARFYMQAGFHLTEYIAADAADAPLLGAFLQRKGNPHDIVLFHGPGPRLHHFAYTSPDTATMLHACDVAGELGFGTRVERGPGRHGPGHALYTYFRDPDGHRVEIFNTHYQTIDSEIPPVRWDPADTGISTPWGLPAREAWFVETTTFADTETVAPAMQKPPRSLERYLAGTVQ
jgi:catechol 2,3-dioxygenase